MIRRLLVGVMLAAMVATPASAVGLEDILVDPRAWDGARITITGELVGDYGRRGGRVWVQLNDDAYSSEPLLESRMLGGTNVGVGVSVPIGLFDEEWGPPGRFGVHGPVVEVTGTFWFSDPREGGETYLEAQHVVLVSPSRPVAAPEAPWTLGAGLALIGLAAAIRFSTPLRRRPS